MFITSVVLGDSPPALEFALIGEAFLRDKGWADEGTLAQPNYNAVVVVKELKIVSIGVYFIDDIGAVFIPLLFTDPAHRGEGLCTKVIRKIQELNPLRKVSWGSHINNVVAQRLYDKIATKAYIIYELNRESV